MRYIFLYVFLLVSCSSTKKTDDVIMNKTLTSIKNQLTSMEARQKTLEVNLETLKKNMKSGIFLDNPVPLDSTQSETDSLKIPPVDIQKSPMLETNNFSKNLDKKSEEKKQSEYISKNLLKPQELISIAESKIISMEYGESLLKVQELNKYFPNFQDFGRRYLIEAADRIYLKEYDLALTTLNLFYQKYPNSKFTQRAKFYEAQANEGMKKKEKAYDIYSEIVEIDPYSIYAETSKAAMKRIKNEK